MSHGHAPPKRVAAARVRPIAAAARLDGAPKANGKANGEDHGIPVTEQQFVRF
jgi:hypothetical protein